MYRKEIRRTSFKILGFIAILCLICLTISTNAEGTRLCTGSGPDEIVDITFTHPVKSGPVETVPWENNERFLKAREETGARVMLGAYCTVLKDPLPGEEFNVHLAARLLAGTVIQPGQVFSQNQKIGPYDEARGFQKGPTYAGNRLTTTVGGGVCKIASTLYNVAVLSNLQIVERQCHSMPVPYVPYGQDATVAYGARDFKFRNDTSYPVLIWAQGIENNLYMAFYGTVKPPKIEWQHEILSSEKAQVIYMKNPQLPAGEKKTVLEGMDGATVKSWVVIENPDGTTVTKNMGISHYMPMNHIVEVGE